MRLSYLLLAFLVGCSGAPTAPAAKPDAVRAEAAETAALQSALSQAGRSTDYRIGAADLLEITVFQQDDLKRVQRVSANGHLTFPLVGSLKVGGLSVTEAENALSAKLAEYIKEPQVTILIKEYGNKKIFVLGQVMKPGSFELPTEAKLTVLEAVSLAGGFTPIAAPDRTKVMRVVNGKSEAFTIEVSAITKRGEKQKDMPLEPNDIVFVPESFF